MYNQLLFGEWKIFFKNCARATRYMYRKKIKLIPLSFYKNKLRWTIAVRNKYLLNKYIGECLSDFEVNKMFWIEHKEQYPQKDRLINLTLP